jgi:hypothetical protein
MQRAVWVRGRLKNRPSLKLGDVQDVSLIFETRGRRTNSPPHFSHSGFISNAIVTFVFVAPFSPDD